MSGCGVCAHAKPKQKSNTNRHAVIACNVDAIQRRPYHYVVRANFLENWSRWYLIWRQKNIHILCVHT